MAKKPKADEKPAPPTLQPDSAGMIRYDDFKSTIDSGLGFERVKAVHGSTYQDNSTIVIVPSRDDKFHWRVVQSWQNLISPMNQKRAWVYVIGDEVGKAYNQTIKNILADPLLKDWKYVLTLESDNIVPMDAHVRLLESINEFKFDAVGGIYWTKGEINMPMAYGNAEEFKRTGVLDFKPLDVREALTKGNVVEVNGIAMGCSLYRLDMFKQIEEPWFVTVADVVEGKGAQGFTQDLWFCQKAKAAGKRFAVDMRVKVGHLDLGTGTVY